MIGRLAFVVAGDSFGGRPEVKVFYQECGSQSIPCCRKSIPCCRIAKHTLLPTILIKNFNFLVGLAPGSPNRFRLEGRGRDSSESCLKRFRWPGVCACVAEQSSPQDKQLQSSGPEAFRFPVVSASALPWPSYQTKWGAGLPQTGVAAV